jgi:hypothetical protein
VIRLFVVFGLLGSSLLAASLTGQWKLDPSRSRMDPPVRLVWEAAGPKNYRHTSPSFNKVPWPVDGTPVPSPTEDGIFVSRKRVSDRLIEEIRTQKGKAISKVVRSITPDGKRLVVTGSGANAEGEKFSYTTYYKRVGAPGFDPLTGTWEEDFFAQAKEAILLTISDTAERFSLSGKGYSWSAPFSGMLAPVKLPWADHARVERAAAGHVKAQLTKASRVTRDEEYSVSADGQTLTLRRRMPGSKPARGFLETYVRVR